MTEWTPAMRRYDLYPRIGSEVCDILKGIPSRQRTSVEEVMSQIDPDLIKDDDPADVHDAVLRLMDEECSDTFGYLSKDECGYYRRSLEDYPPMSEIAKKIRRDDWRENWEWYASLILMGVFFVMLILFHVYGEQWGARIISIPFFGFSIAIQDILFLTGIVMLWWYRLLN